MTFGNAVSACFAKYAIFEGRASRSEFWWFYLANILAAWLATLAFSHPLSLSNSDDEAMFAASWMQIIVSAVFFIPTLAVSARRLHDTNRSGWWYLLSFTLIGLIPLLIWWCQTGDPHSNSHGCPTEPLAPGDTVVARHSQDADIANSHYSDPVNQSGVTNRVYDQKIISRGQNGRGALFFFVITSMVLFLALAWTVLVPKAATDQNEINPADEREGASNEDRVKNPEKFKRDIKDTIYSSKKEIIKAGDVSISENEDGEVLIQAGDIFIED
jgi:uncharacterized membrane protein YhaH (DUF805 family)